MCIRDSAYSTLVQDGYVVNYIESANNMLWGEVELDTSSYAYKNDTLRVITIAVSYTHLDAYKRQVLSGT